MQFASVLLAGPAPQAEAPAAPPLLAAIIEIEMKGARVRLPGDAPPSTVAAAIKALLVRP